jgi:PhoPQ-activated pathogenicity-related protein
VVKDSKPANYKISIAPYYRQGYFINKTLLIRKKKLIDGHAQYLKARVILKITLPFYVHGPMYTY